MSDTLSHVHETLEAVASVEMTPPHAPRVETEAYRKAHRYLIDVQDTPCKVCGVRKSTLGDPTQNKVGAKQMESHHYPIERSLMDACDPNKVHKQFPQVIDRETLEAFVDSAVNLVILCDVHHRSVTFGIHHLLTQDFAILPFLYDGYIVSAPQAQAAQAMAVDNQIEQQEGLEQAA